MDYWSINQLYIGKIYHFSTIKMKWEALPKYLYNYYIFYKISDVYVYSGRIYEKYAAGKMAFKEKSNFYAGDLIPIWPYLSKEEVETQFISTKRIRDIQSEVDGFFVKKNDIDGIIRLKPKLK